MADTRFLASTGSLFANLVLFGAILAALPVYVSCYRVGCPAYVFPTPVPTGRPLPPFLISVDPYGFVAKSGPQCPSPEAQGRPFEIAVGPLPAGFDPSAYPGKAMYACVLVTRGGEVLEARLAGDRPPLGLDWRVIRTILATWRFSPNGLDHEDARWVRVGLNSGARRAAQHDPSFHVAE